MKARDTKLRSQKNSERREQRDASEGRSALSLKPPRYGIDFADRTHEDSGTIQRTHGSLSSNSAEHENRTGLTDSLRAGVERLSGLDMSGVRVHYNSSKPEQVNALAYTQGTEIHVGPGQERHLPHEAWHVVQQMQGRVRPTIQAKGVSINDDSGLEREADEMGAKAAGIPRSTSFAAAQGTPATKGAGLIPQRSGPNTNMPIMRKLGFEMEIPVTLLTEADENVDTKMAFAESKDKFTVQGDKSPKGGKMTQGDNSWSPTIIELVTAAIDEHEEGSREKLLDIIQAIEDFRETLKQATNGYKAETTLGSVSQAPIGLTKPDYAKYKVNKKTEGSGDPESAYLHLTVGVSLEALLSAGNWIAKRSVKQYPGLKTHEKAFSVIGRLREMILADKDYNLNKEWNGWDEEDDRIVSFIYLAIGQIGAIESKNNPDLKVKGAGSVKNYTPFLSRAPFHQVRKLLSEAARAFLSRHETDLKVLIREVCTEWDDEPLTSDAEKFMNDIFNMEDKSPPTKYFGGMKTASVESTGNDLKGPPVEIRSLGTDLTPHELKKTILEVMKVSKNQWK